MKLRAARASDVGELTGLRNALIENTTVTFTTTLKTPDDLLTEINEAPFFIVAEQDAQIIGYASYGAFRKGPGYVHTIEHSIHIADGFTGAGLGSAMMDALEADARATGKHAIVAGISSSNPRSIAFHTRRGFVEVGRMPEIGRKWGRWLDLILLQKTL